MLARLPRIRIMLPILLVLVGVCAVILGIIRFSWETSPTYHLSRALRSGKVEVRRTAAVELGNYAVQAIDSAPALIAALDDDDPAVRAAAASSLRRVGGLMTKAIPSLVRMLGDGDVRLRREAAESLAPLRSESPAVLNARIAALTDQDAEVRYWAAVGLKNMGSAAKPATPQLIAATHDPDLEVRVAAIRAVDSIGAWNMDFYAVLLDAVEDSEPRARQAAVQALLPYLGRPPGFLAVWNATLDNAPEVGGSAAQVLSYSRATPPQDVLPVLIAGLGSEDASRRDLTVSLLGRLGESARTAASFLAPLARNEAVLRPDYTRIFADDPLLESDVVQDIQRAEHAARVLGNIAPNSPEAEAVASLYLRDLRGEDPLKRNRALQVLVSYGWDPRVIEAVREVERSDDDPGVRSGARWALERIANWTLIQELRSPDSTRRRNAAEQLGTFNEQLGTFNTRIDSSIINTLLEMERIEDDVRVRAAVQRVLDQIDKNGGYRAR